MAALLGITYNFGKALPKIFSTCLIPSMNTAVHMGEKLEQEAKRLGLKPAQVAEVFGVKPPSVYDWYAHGRIHKKHYPTLVEWSGKPIEWWLDFPTESIKTEQQAADYAGEDPRHKILLELFEGLPSKEQTELIRSLTEKKQYYDTLIEDLMSKRKSA